MSLVSDGVGPAYFAFGVFVTDCGVVGALLHADLKDVTCTDTSVSCPTVCVRLAGLVEFGVAIVIDEVVAIVIDVISTDLFRCWRGFARTWTPLSISLAGACSCATWGVTGVDIAIFGATCCSAIAGFL